MELTLSNLSENRWRVLQPAIYLISILPVVVCALALGSQVSFSYFVWVGSAIVLIQHGINVFNDETDWKKGADIEKKDSWYFFHHENMRALKAHAWGSFLLGTVLGIALVVHLKRLEVFWVALPLLALGFFYNHSRWTLSYSAFGEWVTGICYGPGVFGCMTYLFTAEVSLQVVLGSLAFSFLAVAVLLSHQPPQVLTDFAAGKRSFAVRNGVERTYAMARVLTSLSLLFLSLIFIPFHIPAMVGLVLLIVCIYQLLPKRLSPPLVLKIGSLYILLLGLVSALGGL